LLLRLHLQVNRGTTFNDRVNNYLNRPVIRDFVHGASSYHLSPTLARIVSGKFFHVLRALGPMSYMLTIGFANYQSPLLSFLESTLVLPLFIEMVSFIFSLYLIVTVFNRMYNGFKYLFTGQFLVFNSPLVLGTTARRVVGNFAQGVGIGIGLIGGAAGLVTAVNTSMDSANDLASRYDFERPFPEVPKNTPSSLPSTPNVQSGSPDSK
jgi:hypothetical protein